MPRAVTITAEEVRDALASGGAVFDVSATFAAVGRYDQVPELVACREHDGDSAAAAAI